MVKRKKSCWVTTSCGITDGVGACVEDAVGVGVGEAKESFVVSAVAVGVGDDVGEDVGDDVGDTVGDDVGAGVGSGVGDGVGNTMHS